MIIIMMITLLLRIVTMTIMMKMIIIISKTLTIIMTIFMMTIMTMKMIMTIRIVKKGVSIHSQWPGRPGWPGPRRGGRWCL